MEPHLFALAIGQLGDGGFSVVKSAFDKRYGKTVAIKSINKEALSPAVEGKLMEEISILRQVNHPNIIRLHDVYDEPEHWHLVMEFVGGGDLFSRLESVEAFSEKYSRNVCKAILGALAHLHSKGISHRDIKPENVLLENDSEDSKVKLADFGFAKKELVPYSFSTMCGTPAYVAPEIVCQQKYGLSCDMWSLGVLTFIMLGGYQPFMGESDAEVEKKIVAGEYNFDKEYFKHVSSEAKSFIAQSCLVVDAKKRQEACKALGDSWFRTKIVDETISKENEPLVFFMVGSQRSGSNWLRTMLDEREDLAGPHPPHMMRDFSSRLDRYGDLSDDTNFRILVDHVATFVERNQVPWTDKHGQNIKFARALLFEIARSSCQRVQKARRVDGDNQEPIPPTMYLLSVFDAIMTQYTKLNGKVSDLWSSNV